MEKNTFEEPILSVYQLTEEDALDTAKTSARDDWGGGEVKFDIPSV